MTTTYPDTITDATGRTWDWSDIWGGYRSEGQVTHGYDTINREWGIASAGQCEQIDAEAREDLEASPLGRETCATCGSTCIEIIHWASAWSDQIVGMTCSRSCADAFNAKRAVTA